MKSSTSKIVLIQTIFIVITSANVLRSLRTPAVFSSLRIVDPSYDDPPISEGQIHGYVQTLSGLPEIIFDDSHIIASSTPEELDNNMKRHQLENYNRLYSQHVLRKALPSLKPRRAVYDAPALKKGPQVYPIENFAQIKQIFNDNDDYGTKQYEKIGVIIGPKNNIEDQKDLTTVSTLANEENKKIGPQVNVVQYQEPPQIPVPNVDIVNTLKPEDVKEPIHTTENRPNYQIRNPVPVQEKNIQNPNPPTGGQLSPPGIGEYKQSNPQLINPANYQSDQPTRPQQIYDSNQYNNQQPERDDDRSSQDVPEREVYDDNEQNLNYHPSRNYQGNYDHERPYRRHRRPYYGHYRDHYDDDDGEHPEYNGEEESDYESQYQPGPSYYDYEQHKQYRPQQQENYQEEDQQYEPEEKNPDQRQDSPQQTSYQAKEQSSYQTHEQTYNPMNRNQQNQLPQYPTGPQQQYPAEQQSQAEQQPQYPPSQIQYTTEKQTQSSIQQPLNQAEKQQQYQPGQQQQYQPEQQQQYQPEQQQQYQPEQQQQYQPEQQPQYPPEQQQQYQPEQQQQYPPGQQTQYQPEQQQQYQPEQQQQYQPEQQSQYQPEQQQQYPPGQQTQYQPEQQQQYQPEQQTQYQPEQQPQYPPEQQQHYSPEEQQQYQPEQQSQYQSDQQIEGKQLSQPDPVQGDIKQKQQHQLDQEQYQNEQAKLYKPRQRHVFRQEPKYQVGEQSKDQTDAVILFKPNDKYGQQVKNQPNAQQGSQSKEELQWQPERQTQYNSNTGSNYPTQTENSKEKVTIYQQQIPQGYIDIQPRYQMENSRTPQDDYQDNGQYGSREENSPAKPFQGAYEPKYENLNLEKVAEALNEKKANDDQHQYDIKFVKSFLSEVVKQLEDKYIQALPKPARIDHVQGTNPQEAYENQDQVNAEQQADQTHKPRRPCPYRKNRKRVNPSFQNTQPQLQYNQGDNGNNERAINPQTYEQSDPNTQEQGPTYVQNNQIALPYTQSTAENQRPQQVLQSDQKYTPLEQSYQQQPAHHLHKEPKKYDEDEDAVDKIPVIYKPAESDSSTNSDNQENSKLIPVSLYRRPGIQEYKLPFINVNQFGAKYRQEPNQEEAVEYIEQKKEEQAPNERNNYHNQDDAKDYGKLNQEISGQLNENKVRNGYGNQRPTDIEQQAQDAYGKRLNHYEQEDNGNDKKPLIHPVPQSNYHQVAKQHHQQQGPNLPRAQLSSYPSNNGGPKKPKKHKMACALSWGWCPKETS